MRTAKLSKLIVVTALIVLLESVTATPLKELNTLDDDVSKELNDLNKPTKKSDSKSETDKTKVFEHHDEDQQSGVFNLEADQNMKYDVEVLEIRDIKKENNELEERFRGPAIEMDTDTFVAENIEVNGADDDDDDDVQPNHMVAIVIVVFVALLSISVYAALVIWRASLEQRYAMRELLVNAVDDDVDDDYYQPSVVSVASAATVQQMC